MQGIWNTSSDNKKGKWPGSIERAENDAPSNKPSRELLRKVLVVDDEQDLADMTAALLSARGLEVLVAYSGHAAMQFLADNHDIDAVFSDVMMPGMTGLQMADAIREMYPTVKIVLASGYTLPSLLTDRERPYLYTPKPYKIDTVLALLRT